MIKILCLSGGYLAARTLSDQSFNRWDRYVLAPAKASYQKEAYQQLPLIVFKGALKVWVMDESPNK